MRRDEPGLLQRIRRPRDPLERRVFAVARRGEDRADGLVLVGVAEADPELVHAADGVLPRLGETTGFHPHLGAVGEEVAAAVG